MEKAKEKSRRVPGELILLITAILWSTSGVCIKYIPWSALSVACFRSFCTMLLFLSVQLMRHEKPIAFTRANVLGAIAMCASGLTFVAGMKMTTAANATVLEYTAPSFVLIYTLIKERRKPTVLELTTTLAVTAGCVLAFADQLGGGKLLGNLVATLSGVCFAALILAQRNPKTNPMQSQLMGNALSCIIALPFLLTDPTFTVNPQIAGAALFLGFIQYGLSHICFGIGIQRVDAIRSGIIMTTEPILGPVWVFLLIGEKPGPLALAGFVLVMGAVIANSVIPMIMAKKEKKHDPMRID